VHYPRKRWNRLLASTIYLADGLLGHGQFSSMFRYPVNSYRSNAQEPGVGDLHSLMLTSVLKILVQWPRTRWGPRILITLIQPSPTSANYHNEARGLRDPAWRIAAFPFGMPFLGRNVRLSWIRGRHWVHSSLDRLNLSQKVEDGRARHCQSAA
jgi:hypothetical protein